MRIFNFTVIKELLNWLIGREQQTEGPKIIEEEEQEHENINISLCKYCKDIYEL